MKNDISKNVGDYTITSFVLSKEGKQLSNKRALYHINERLLNYDTSSTDLVQSINNPISIALCPTSICVRKCEFCSNTQRNLTNSKNNVMYSEKILREIMKDLKELDVKGVSIAGGGEPLTYNGDLLNEFFVENGKTYKIGIHTNGVYLEKALTPEIISKKYIQYINVSVVAHNNELYNKVTGGDEKQFLKIEKNIKNVLVRNKNLFTFGVKILLSRTNYKYVDEIYDYYKRMGVNNILLRCVGNFEPNQDVELFPEQIEELVEILNSKLNISMEQINGIINKTEKYELPVPSRCWINCLGYVAGIDPDGETYLCSAWSRKGYSIGNVNISPLSDIWNSTQHKKIVNKLNNNLTNGLCNPLLCRHYYSNLAIEAYINELMKLPNMSEEKDYCCFI